MSRPTIPVIIATCLLAGLLIATNRVPRIWADQAMRQAAHVALVPAIQSSLPEAAEREGRRLAAEIAKKPADRQGHSVAAEFPNPGSSPEARRLPAETAVEPAARAENRPQAPAPVEAGLDSEPTIVSRQAFRITLPPGCVVDSKASGADREHRVAIDVPGHGLIYIIVVDNKGRASSVYGELLSQLRAKGERAEVAAHDLLDSLRPVRAAGISCRIKGMPAVYQMGQLEGWDKGLVVLTEFLESDRGQAEPPIRQALATLRIKE